MNDTSESKSDIDAVLAQVLLIFAARGRAIREERAKLEAARSLDASAIEDSADQEVDPPAQEKNEKTQGL